MTTDSEMYRVRSPSLKTAMRIWMAPTSTPSRNRASNSPVRFSGSRNASELNTSSEMALVGPLIRCDEDPKIDAMAVTTIAE
ncbi:Uncharacterised protein [Mycobacteroides abscessus subsp. massiliense]|nr:Uncharacterised protein [Mycobacteroides abscessus subsp. massiliense]